MESLTEEGVEKLMKAIDEKKKLISTLRAKPWPVDKKLSTLRSNAYSTLYTEIWVYPLIHCTEMYPVCGIITFSQY